jgi:ABC-type antimicrobial peptide transport system permease subunit
MEDFVDLGRFVFSSSLADSVEEKENPWILLNKVQQDGSIPFIGDANSMSYALHVKLGEEFILKVAGDRVVRLKLVGTLSDSLFQSELLISEENFVRLFPNQQGFRFFLIDNLASGNQEIISTLEENLSDFGFDVSSTVERLAGYHRVENTYLSTFQTLGGMGLILGTFGLGAVLLRNVLERRQELALLRAVGYRSIHLLIMAITENALLLAWGIVTGSICALIAIAPAMLSRGGSVSFLSFGTILVLVLACGFLSSIIAIWGVLKAPILPALRSE